jgi:hypothetical protein
MDYRPFELANDQCKPKHFAPPTATQLRLARAAAYCLAPDEPRPGVLRRLLGWLRAAAERR